MGNLRDELKKFLSKDRKDPASRKPASTAMPITNQQRPILSLRHPSPAPTVSRSTPPKHEVPPTRPKASSSPPAALKPTVNSAAIAETTPPIPKHFLTRQAEFKAPDSWVASGASLQVPNVVGSRVLPVRIGIDFGTAYTKVAISTAQRVFFVPWNGVRLCKDNDHFLPGEISRTSDGATWLGCTPGCSEPQSDLKLPFLTPKDCNDEQRAGVVVFLAWVMRYARAWLYHHHSGVIAGRKLAWEVNLGCPSNNWQDRKLTDLYKGLGLRAWKLSQDPTAITWSRALEMLPPLRESAEAFGLHGLKLMPEFIAQIAGYVNSPQRKNGLHFLMDVGAGTIDVATFNVHFDEQAGENRFPIFASEVCPLGTHFLMAERLRELRRQDASWDDLQAVPKAEDLARQLRADKQAVLRADAEFTEKIAHVIRRLVSYTRNKRYGKAPEWKSGVPAFMSGGGSDCEVYVSALSGAFKQLGFRPLLTQFPQLQETLRNASLAGSHFHRLSVAYGLTYDVDDIGKILAPHEVLDAPRYDPAIDALPQRKDFGDNYLK